MDLSALLPQNTRNARAVGINAFKKFLEDQAVTIDFVTTCMKTDKTGNSIAAVMERFALYLLAKNLAKNTIMSYYRQVKNWIIDEYPLLKPVINDRLLKMSRTVEKFSVKRETGGMVKQAIACTKIDLELLVTYLFKNSTSEQDMQDGALLILIWYLFGRASDLALLNKSNITLAANKVLFLRLVRMKTSEEQGLSLVPDHNPFTCPIFAIAVSLAMQKAPSPRLFDHLPTANVKSMEEVEICVVPLGDVLTNLVKTNACKPQPCLTENPPKFDKSGVDRGSGINSHINRLLSRVSHAAGVKTVLTSHSFRRGGAQHANSDHELSAQWIFDRGAWNMQTTSKAFAYVFNTTQEDQKVARVLSGWSSLDVVNIKSLTGLDSHSVEAIRRLQKLVFNTCVNQASPYLNVDHDVLDVCIVRLIQAYSKMATMAPESQIVKKMQCAANLACVSESDILKWSLALSCVDVSKSNKSENQKADVTNQGRKIDELLETTRLLIDRLSKVESAAVPKKPTQASSNSCHDEDILMDIDEPIRRKSRTIPLSATWFEWFAGIPRLSESEDRKRRSDGRLLVAYMKLFVGGSLQLHPTEDDYNENVRQLGLVAQEKVVCYLKSLGIKACGSTAVLKHMRHLHREGKLDSRIREYRALVRMQLLNDPSPPLSRDILVVATEL